MGSIESYNSLELHGWYLASPEYGIWSCKFIFTLKYDQLVPKEKKAVQHDCWRSFLSEVHGWEEIHQHQDQKGKCCLDIHMPKIISEIADLWSAVWKEIVRTCHKYQENYMKKGGNTFILKMLFFWHKSPCDKV